MPELIEGGPVPMDTNAAAGCAMQARPATEEEMEQKRREMAEWEARRRQEVIGEGRKRISYVEGIMQGHGPLHDLIYQLENADSTIRYQGDRIKDLEAEIALLKGQRPAPIPTTLNPIFAPPPDRASLDRDDLISQAEKFVGTLRESAGVLTQTSRQALYLLENLLPEIINLRSHHLAEMNRGMTFAPPECLNDLRDICFKVAASKGWWGDKAAEAIAADDPTWMGYVEERNIGELLALIGSEVSEALEDARMVPHKDHRTRLNEMSLAPAREGESNKPIGFPSEMADILIRVFDLCGYLGIDLDRAVTAKVNHNRSRSYRHGGKSA